MNRFTFIPASVAFSGSLVSSGDEWANPPAPEVGITVWTPATGCIPEQPFVFGVDLGGVGISDAHAATGNRYNYQWSRYEYFWNTDIGGPGRTFSHISEVRGTILNRNDKFMVGAKVMLMLDEPRSRDVGVVVADRVTGQVVAWGRTTIRPRSLEEAFPVQRRVYLYRQGDDTSAIPSGAQRVEQGPGQEFTRNHAKYRSHLPGGSDNPNGLPTCFLFPRGRTINGRIVFQPQYDGPMQHMRFCAYGPGEYASFMPLSTAGATVFQQLVYDRYQPTPQELAIVGLDATSTFNAQTDNPQATSALQDFVAGGVNTYVTLGGLRLRNLVMGVAFSTSIGPQPFKMMAGNTIHDGCGGQYPFITGIATHPESLVGLIGYRTHRNPLTDRSKGAGGGESIKSNVRINYTTTNIIQKSDFFGTQGLGQGDLKLQEMAPGGLRSYSNVSDTVFHSLTGQHIRVNTTGAPGGSHNARVLNMFWARNYFFGGPHVNEGFHVRAQGLTMVANYLSGSNSNCDTGMDVYVNFHTSGSDDPAGRTAAPNYFINNTFGIGRTNAQNAGQGVPGRINANGHNAIDQSNVTWAPNFSSPVETHSNLTEDSYLFTSWVTATNWTGTISATYAIPPTAYPTLKPKPGSSAIGGARGERTFLSLEQEVRDYRDLVLSADVGAYQSH